MSRTTLFCSCLFLASSMAMAIPMPYGSSAPEATLWLESGEGGYFGWYQRVPITPGAVYEFNASWTGDSSDPGDAVLLIIPGTDTMTSEEFNQAIDVPASEHVIAKNSVFDVPPTWDWETIVHTDSFTANEVTVAFMMGCGYSDNGNWASADNISLLDVDNGNTDLIVNSGFDDGENNWTRWQAYWGTGNWAITPEPTSLVILLGGCVMLLRRQ